MKIVFHPAFYDSSYASDCAAAPGRIEAIIPSLQQEKAFDFVRPEPAAEPDILRCHDPAYYAEARNDAKRFDMAMLAAGAASLAAEIGMAAGAASLATEIGMTGEPAFAVIRPPGHHASYSSSWGYCTFCNMAVALLKLKARNEINSAFILDFDAHTGDGTRDILTPWKDCHILNPYRETSAEYLQEINDFIRPIQQVDVVAICAGFDSYEKDVGRKLTTFDFYQIGFLMKNFAKRASNGRRFAILEGGYYLPDLGKNVLAFCQGFS